MFVLIIVELEFVIYQEIYMYISVSFGPSTGNQIDMENVLLNYFMRIEAEKHQGSELQLFSSTSFLLLACLQAIL